MKISVYIATSLDGFIARKDGSINWLIEADNSGGSDDFGFREFFDTTDCLVMGRNTMEKVLSFGEWPYGDKRVIVLTNTLKEVPSELVGKIELSCDSIEELVKNLESEGHKHLYIDGGKTIQSFIDADLLTDITITKIPVIIGEGLPLFGKTKHDIKLTHIETRLHDCGFVKSIYKVKRASN
ncbi:MAG: dihydrofolate reductase [Sulfurimonas sp.]|nr:dihydrofolate reductase [Sulfurimonas sp.]